MTAGAGFLAGKLVGDRLHHLEIHVGGLSLLTSGQIRLNVFNRFWIDGFDGGHPMSMIGRRIESIDDRGDRIAMTVGGLVVNTGLRDGGWTGPEDWLMQPPDGTLVVENGN